MGSNDVASVLRAKGARVEIHDDHLPQHATDDEWLTFAGERGWVVLTKDDRIRHRFLERQAVIRAKVRAFYLAPKRLTGVQNGEIFAKALTRIERFCLGNQPPFIARVFADGVVKMWERPKF